ncbi:CBS domain-containing ParB/RepB/Spo0J family partition protein [Halapricum desulfuricans]|uniref:Chromosome segregation protein Spo0J, contains ParB-like nuclease domain n=1 Tax=Halapricum desulfuricans TaxID=2841257 RepID=A0A897N5M8_9EURY|nr:CBS domain-containing protein [Halapricum desulfuricans]QSG09700.1 Chromosome segregation protein Spo0J, contains ParB-like nuclease domain [Halapricum desulfuricans]
MMDSSDGSLTVEEYMTREVSTVTPTSTVGEVARRIADSDDHSGLPVTDDSHVEGFVSASDLLLADDDTEISEVMSTDLLVAHPEMDLDDAARVILRSGIQRLPVVDDDGDLVGIISNTDVIRSQIERATPDKVAELQETIEEVHGVEADQERRQVSLAALRPTQTRVYADELEGRSYELERGLAEPLVVVDNDGELLLVDGHHRTTAASELGIEEMEAYVIRVDRAVELEMAKTAEEEDLQSVDDITIVDYARHPLVETTERMGENDADEADSS